MHRPSVTPSSRPPRVIWTDAEKAKVVSRAVDTQQEHPDLAGLPLLRVAMQVLHPSRRRKLIAVTQAPWFEPAVVAEIKRRTAEEKARGDIGPIIREVTHERIAQLSGWMKTHKAWQEQEHAEHAEMISLLAGILSELKELNAKLGSPVPMIDPRDSARPHNGWGKNRKA